MASSMPLRVLRPTEASAPVSGRSIPILIVLPVGPPLPEHAASDRPSAKAASEAARRRMNITGRISGHPAVPYRLNVPVPSRRRELANGGGIEIRRFRVVHDDRGGRLLGHDL